MNVRTLRNASAPSIVINPFVAGLAKTTNQTFTENGALTNKSTLNPLLDWFALGGALRSRSESDIISIFQKAWGVNPINALKILFYFRDVRGGQGERRTFRNCYNWLARNHSKTAINNLKNIPFYGRWDDLYCLIDTEVEKYALDLIKIQLRNDYNDMKEGKSVSLLAKWLKSENTSSKESRVIANKIRKYLKLTPRQYRKTLSALRSYIDVVEVKMCSGEWNDIDFSKVPSIATKNYRKSFKKHDQSRWVDYLNKVERGEAKINAKALYPYEILRSILRESDETGIKALDLQWENQPNWLAENPHYGLVISDVSGSMTTGDGLPILVSVSLAIYFAERNIGPFTDCFMTFSDNCQLQKLDGSNLKEKAENLSKDGWCGSTNLQSAFDAILETAKKYKVKQSDMPSVLYIISDMEFNVACDTNDKTNFEEAKNKFNRAGYKFPKIVFWNVDAKNDQAPITEDERGVCLVSGCSPSILKSLLSGKPFDPISILEDVINQERYDRITL